MKKLIYLFILALAFSCKKSDSGNGGGAVQEPAIVFTTDAVSTSVGNISLSSSFPVIVTLTSQMPSTSGINIAATVIDQTNNATITQNTAITSTATINNIQLINLPRQHWCTVTVKVTSVSRPSNFAAKTFNVVYK